MNIDDVLIALGHLIRMRRIMLRLPMYDLAERSDISLNYCSQILHGKRNPSFFVVVSIAHALGLTVSDLLDGFEDLI